LPANFDEQLAYILFTSGSTGVPKGVPITMKNLEAFIQAFLALGYDVNENDRFMQMFELTFDFSVFTTFAPLCIGASVHTVSSDGIKFANVYITLEEQNITFAAMVPSVINYLRPYFEEMKFEHLKYSLFCGEALIAEVAKEWKQCMPKGVIENAYGPTEATVFCMMYSCFTEMDENKTYNGGVSIGKAMLATEIIVVDENLKPLPANTKGELCIASTQLTPGYWKDVEKNKEAFFPHIINGKEKMFYRSGDLALYDEQGDFMFGGRLDYQVKFQGFRVELGEIEHHARVFSGVANTAALVYETETGNQILYLLLENYDADFLPLKEYLTSKVPHYMVPSKIFSLTAFPFNNNGKVDRKILQQKLKELGQL
ncbi:MAG: AMP-binding protein, partial [Ignavibacteriaceae bacterium]|nr:AMP-binding protein [Ignavibacteriaceae bacterium]